MKPILFLAGLAALPLAANAADFDYTYVEGNYVTGDAGPGNADGLGVKGSYALNGKANLVADYTTQDFGSGVDASTFDIGAGAHWGIKADLDFVGEATWVNVKTSTPFGSGSDNGLGLAGGLRYRATDKLELQGMVHYVDVQNSNTSLDLAGRYYLSKAFSIVGGLLLDNGDTAWNVGVRAGFGRR